jgi:very-short-patch-repair endonuclease
MSQLDDALLSVFIRQHWLVSIHDVREHDGDADAAYHRVHIGRWEIADRSVFRLVGPPQTWHTAVLAPILSVGGRTAASHYTAAALHGIPGFARGTPEISIERGLNHRRSGLRTHTSSDLERCRTPVIAGIPTTDFARTVLDLARTTRDKRLLRAAEWGRRQDLTSWTDLISTLARHARKGRPGVRRLRRVIAGNAARSEITDSDFELLVLTLLREHGLPEPTLHHKVFDGDRFVAEVDLAYPSRRIAIELDGSVHLDAHVRERDLPRQNDLVLLGWTVLRFTWQRFVDRPDLVIAEILSALRSPASVI